MRYAIPCLLLLLAAEATAQRPRRFPRPGTSPGGEATATPESAPLRKEKVERWTAVAGADVHLGTGEVMRRATVLIGDDRIFGVGPDLELPEGTTLLDAKGRVVCPGFIAVRCSPIGVGSGGGGGGALADAVNPFDPTIKQALAAGITSYLHSAGGGGFGGPGGGPGSGGSSALPSGQTTLVKLAFGDLKGMVVRENPVLTMSVPLDPQQWDTLRDLVQKSKKHKEDAARTGTPPASGGAAPAVPSGGQPGPQAPRAPAGTENILKVMNGEARLWISCRSGFQTEEIRQALQVSKLLGVGVVLDQPVTPWVIPDEIAACDSMVILSPRAKVAADKLRPDVTGSNIAAAAILAEAGVPVAVTPPGSGFGGGPSVGTGGILGQDLNTPHIDAAYAVRGGMDNREALRTLTADAARIVNASARLGTIEAGKDADLLILDGDPLHYRSFVHVALVNGKVVYEKAKEPFYSHVQR
jgi:hypothetical protein